MMVLRRAHVDEVVTTGGMVTAPEEAMAEAGAAMLRRGGNAVDAAVAMAFAGGVVEPYMSGLGGGTTMTVALRGPDRCYVVDGHLRSPLAATPEEFPLAEEEPNAGWPVSWFDWPAVVGFQNIVGAKSVGVPGTVAALCEAHERWGRRSLREVLEPAIRLADEGFEISWFFAAITANEMKSLARDEGCAEVFLPGGWPPRGPGVGPAHRLVQPGLAETLGTIAEIGPDVFYRGRVGRSIVERVRSLGGLLTMDDLERYKPQIIESPLVARYGRYDVVGAPVSGLPTALQILGLYDAARDGNKGEVDAIAWARAIRLALRDRALYMSADPGVEVPWGELRSSEYLQELFDAFLSELPLPEPGDTESLEPRAAPAPSSGFTTQMSAVDRDGSMVSLTQTVLNTYGARVLDPETGVLLNDGMAYFDTRPDSLNGIRPGALVFSSMMPVVLVDPEQGPAGAVGASGGRRIMSGMAQIIEAVAARGVSLQEAIEEPRIHVEEDAVLLDSRWPRGATEELEAAGFHVEPTVEQPTTVHFARPNGVLVDAEGRRRSGLDPNKPGGVGVE